MVQGKIQVYASFPLVVPNGSDINLAADNWHWVHCLTLPLETLNTLPSLGSERRTRSRTFLPGSSG